jgi:hypothetical protein
VRGAHFVVDVQAVGRAADGDHLGAQLMEHLGRDLVGRAMGGIHHDLQPLQRQVVCEGALAEFDVAAGRIVQPARLAQLAESTQTGGSSASAASTASSQASGSLVPWALKNLMPLSGKGLWLALMTTPRLARWARVR